ncbi:MULTISPECIES: hypothetical protein [Thermomonospora]|uniref:Uncharacterized protein n=1 Tax=Thermomonospora curvata (strain ATCC 19995 / DSM 43183 / JCM 3096 / KCTC 9072 / NBRC 15933 / NCIMB 10081 / Henssen B9) TaxID=471852 RepID=D1A288_THECD|nr:MULTISPECIES: hypothetical protein [Thermomonospora]ACY99741.1 hypothetical protein Tcur_4214 [Thermomonospora curvata DSM 43183]
MEILLGFVLQSAFALTEVKEAVGLIAAVLLAGLAAHAGWHATDRLIALRRRPD